MARRYAELNGLTMRYYTVKDADSKKVVAVEIAFGVDGGSSVDAEAPDN